VRTHATWRKTNGHRTPLCGIGNRRPNYALAGRAPTCPTCQEMLTESKTMERDETIEQAVAETLAAAQRRATPKPAIISISCIFVTCPTCSTDIPITTPDGEETDWPLGCFEDTEGTPAQCTHCGQVVTVTLPRSLPVNP
jgi:hypothetical protein